MIHVFAYGISGKAGHIPKRFAESGAAAGETQLLPIFYGNAMEIDEMEKGSAGKPLRTLPRFQ